MLIAMLVGIFFGLIYKAREMYLPAQPYIDVVFFGIAVGLGASGIYTFVNDRFPPQSKATSNSTKNIRDVPSDKEVI
jgi:xanthosine utilization system XapX-like protein